MGVDARYTVVSPNPKGAVLVAQIIDLDVVGGAEAPKISHGEA
jgi:hypothetical protein